MSSVTPSIDDEDITETTVQVTFTQWNDQMPGQRPDKYLLNVEPHGQLVLLPKLVTSPERTELVDNLQPGTQYRIQIVPVIIPEPGTYLEGIPSQYSQYFRTLPGRCTVKVHLDLCYSNKSQRFPTLSEIILTGLGSKYIR